MENKKLKIIVSGYGKMGRLITKRAAEKGHTIMTVVDPIAARINAPVYEPADAPFYKKAEDIPDDAIAQADVALDFSQPQAALLNMKTFISKKVPLVVGTTGWYTKLEDVKKWINDGKDKNGAPAMLYSSNFSLGVNLFYRLVGEAARLFDNFPEYDVGGLELHHSRKADSPSGTAKTIMRHLLANMKRKTSSVYDKLDAPPKAGDIHFSSLRVGRVPGTHSVFFDSEADTIELKHTARSREGLVSGAIVAAEWLAAAVAAGKSGVFTFDDVLR
jgi:4-hydroxy-tetrahydrodipicolinate reductase